MTALVESFVILPSESRGDTTTRDYETPRFSAADIFVRQTAQGSTTAFVSVKLQGRVPGSTEYYTVATVSPSTTAAFTRRLRVRAGGSTALDSTALTTTTVNEALPAIWRIASTNVSTSAVTYSVSANLYP